MRNIISLAAILLTFVGDFTAVDAGTCLDDVYEGGTSDQNYGQGGTPSCTANNFEFLGVTGAVAFE